MDSWDVAAALTSAALHASWHGVVKSSSNPAQTMTAQMVGSAAIAVPALFWTGLPPPAAWPWMIGSTLFSMGAVACVLRGYEHGGFGVVYPLTRASSVLLVLPLAAAVAGEWPAATGLVGVALVSAAVMVLALRQGGAKGAAQPIPRDVLGWILMAAALTAGYIICDAQGVRRAQSPFAYGFSLSITNGVVWAWLQHRGGSRLLVMTAAEWRRGLLLALAATASYLLILWVWMHAPIALGSALRDTSAVFATLIALFVLKEPFDWKVVLAVILATAGSMLIRLGQ
jgi:drug/metabolite transporter (DMT)-like permease